MDVDFIFRIAAIGILIAVFNQVLAKSGKEDVALLVSLAGTVLVLMMVVEKISALFLLTKELFGL